MKSVENSYKRATFALISNCEHGARIKDADPAKSMERSAPAIVSTDLCGSPSATVGIYGGRDREGLGVPGEAVPPCQLRDGQEAKLAAAYSLQKGHNA
uniref:Uncharacterized protein n=1 Tax=Ascaris lumbricoides TaxID=6252 RepID=A0A0M3HPQ0_ASCLU